MSNSNMLSGSRHHQFTLLARSLFLFFCLIGFTGTLAAQSHSEKHDAKDEEQSEIETLDDVLAGHSFHGEAFNEGPRQQAYLMKGTGSVEFKITTAVPEAQEFFNQGIGQIHGFWDLEAERTFRHVASLDEDCAMAFWGTALATVAKPERSKGFIKKAMDLKDRVSDREKMYIEALSKYINNDKKDKSKRAAAYLKDLESIALKYPDDIEAKALITHRIWNNAREGIPVASYLAADAMLKDIFEKNPFHPAHHYAIHLWDYREPSEAVPSAERCGVSAPSIAHMWHMPGHIYSRLKRYEEAVYQQEASARVDHAHMMRDQVMPDEIGNFAHNNEWLIRNLVFLGRVNDSISLAKNMIELPRHPKYNTLSKKNGSASYGRRRLIQTLREFHLHQQALELCQSNYLRESEIPAEHLKTLRLTGCSASILGKTEIAKQAQSDLEWLKKEHEGKKAELEKSKTVLEMALDQSEDRPPRPKSVYAKVDLETADEELAEIKKKISESKRVADQSGKALLAIEGYQKVAAGEYQAAYDKLKKATGEDVSWLGELLFLAGEEKKGLEEIAKQVKRRPQEVIPLARQVFCLHAADQPEKAKEAFENLRKASAVIDLELPLFKRLETIAVEFGMKANWLAEPKVQMPTEFRPNLDTLGPFRWSAPSAPSWNLVDSEGMPLGTESLKGRPHILIFYLGHGCLHCVEQLQAFAPRVDDFQAAGLDIVAISSDDRNGLSESIADFGDKIPFSALVSDESLEVFKKYRAFDDFESQPLHGTFLIDGNGRICWQDISYEPFMDHEFLFVEAQRLLSQQRMTPSTVESTQPTTTAPTDVSSEE